MIEVNDLTIDYETSSGSVRAVHEVSFTLSSSEILGLVGESGCGKSTFAMTLLATELRQRGCGQGRVLLHGQDLLSLPASEIASYRGHRIGFVPQNSSMGLSPHLRIGSLFTEVAMQHGLASKRSTALSLAIDHFALVGLPSPEEIGKRYPHELSGGQQQRVSIALAIACRPELLVLDEPTTGLDVTTQMRIVELLKDLRSRFKMGMLYVTHDLGVLTQIADRVGVMYAGRLVEVGSTEHLFAAPRHPYPAVSLLRCRASMPLGRARDSSAVCSSDVGFLQVVPSSRAATMRDRIARPTLNLSNRSRQGTLLLADDGARSNTKVQLCRMMNCRVSPLQARSARRSSSLSASVLPIASEVLGVRFSGRGRAGGARTVTVDRRGRNFALVGESGSGKSTIARSLSGLLVPIGGTICFRGKPLAGRLSDRPLELKRQIQYVFQNPDASLNPRELVRRVLGRPLRLYFQIDRDGHDERVARVLHEVRLDPSYASRFPDSYQEVSASAWRLLAVSLPNPP